MKKVIISLLALASIFANSMALNSIYASTNEIEHATRGPLTGPDGENLYPGGDGGANIGNTSPKYQTVIHDTFQSWNTSIFNRSWGSCNIANGFLTMPHNSAVITNPILLEDNTTYRITLGNLTGRIYFEILDTLNGLPIDNRNVFGTGTDVTFLYTHSNYWAANRASNVFIIGESNISWMSSFTIEKKIN